MKKRKRYAADNFSDGENGSMPTLSELVKQDYDAEVEIIRNAGGNLWITGLAAALFAIVTWAFDLFLGEPWNKREESLALIAVVAFPIINREWERHKVSAEMRHEREVRMEMKLNTLLGLVKIEDDE